MKITNNQQLTSLYNRREVKRTQSNARAKVDVIHLECNKPLTSRFYVESNTKGKFKPYYHDTQRNKYRCISFGNTDYEVDRSEGQFHDVGSKEILAEQQRIYNQLKREYERELKAQRGEVDNSHMSKEDKQVIATRTKSVQLLKGLANQPYYDRIYMGV